MSMAAHAASTRSYIASFAPRVAVRCHWFIQIHESGPQPPTPLSAAQFIPLQRFKAPVDGPRLACQAMADWAGEHVGLSFIPPGQPWRSGYVESFNSRIRDERLDINIFWSLAYAPCRDQRLEGGLRPPPRTQLARLPGPSGPWPHRTTCSAAADYSAQAESIAKVIRSAEDANVTRIRVPVKADRLSRKEAIHLCARSANRDQRLGIAPPASADDAWTTGRSRHRRDAWVVSHAV